MPAWPLARATELLKITKFLPNNPQFGDLNSIIFTALQGVETSRLSAEEAADFVIDEATASLKDVIVKQDPLGLKAGAARRNNGGPGPQPLERAWLPGQTEAMAVTNELMIERRGHARSAARFGKQLRDLSGPAIVLTILFFVIPVLIDIAVSFTDLSRSLRITEFTTEQYDRVFRGDRRLPQVIGLTFIYSARSPSST